jgi:signal transduction histidine kinase
LLTDVTLLHREAIERSKIRLEFDLQSGIPRLICRPQLLTAVFSNLLSNAIDAVNGSGRICIQTRGEKGEVSVTIQDNGRGMKPEAVETLFDPSFKVDGGRVSSGNWSLFNSRQIIYEHGGDISVRTAEGQGTEIQVTLPLTAVA